MYIPTRPKFTDDSFLAFGLAERQKQWDDMKKHFDCPSPEKTAKMIEQGFALGLPEKAGWYLVAARSNGDEETYFVHQVWFNPMSIDKFYVGAGSISSKSEPYHLRGNVRAYAQVPSF